MPTSYTLVLMFGPAAARALEEAGSRVALARSAGSGPPNVTWLDADPQPEVVVRWTETYGIYAADAIVPDAGPNIVDSVFPARDGCVYPFNGRFGDPVPAADIPPNHYDVRNDTAAPVVFGLLQEGRIGERAVLAATNAVAVAAGLSADFTALTTLHVRVQHRDGNGEKPGTAAVVSLNPNIPEIRLDFDGATSCFTFTASASVGELDAHVTDTMPLPIPFHQQDNTTFCGSATAQMLAAYLASTVDNPQGSFRDEVVKAAEPLCALATGPNGLAAALNKSLMKHTISARYEAYTCDNATAATDILQRTLAGDAGRVPMGAAALIGDGRHWVAVTGFYPPTGQMKCVFINNPSPSVPPGSSPPRVPGGNPFHTPKDGCGSGGMRGARECIPTQQWFGMQLTDAEPKCLGAKKPIFVVVAAAGLSPVPASPETLRTPALAFEERTAQGDRRMIDAKQALQSLREAMPEYDLAGETRELEHVDPSTAQAKGPTRLVRLLERPGQLYYIVPVSWPADGTTLVGRIDAFDGGFLGAQVRSAGDYSLEAPPAVRAFIEQQRAENGPTASAQYEVVETLAWRFCAESASPYYPFWEITASGEHVAFIGLDGEVYESLHDANG